MLMVTFNVDLIATVYLHYSWRKLLTTVLIMPNMGMRGIGNRKTYAVRRWLQALDRLLKARSMTEKEYAIRWSKAWFTAYVGRKERRRNDNPEKSRGSLERRRRNRFEF